MPPAGHAREMKAQYDSKCLGYKGSKNPAAEVAVNFVITGIEEYGSYTSMDWASSAQGWMMRALRPVINDRELRHVVMLGTHD
ncbi:hypothetical protein B0H66DRAFT_601349 [Apodospora peruviana]|uniref:Uncharacterized protein n=1 Tax=Apodospora peruviana TaxID=516989 RepID=A0AAE0IBH4_9PEZI|nr:hypothetical protein B0H66DRAFT_601349 [Apodospora peruviana]